MARLRSIGPRLATIDTGVARVPPKTVDPHYQSAGHLAWRAEVIRRAGGQCQGDGCGRTGIRLFADHIHELRDGGAALDPANGRALCGSCHTAKTIAERARRMGAPAPVPPRDR